MVATQLSPHSPTLRFALLPLEDFAMLPFGGFIDKLRFTADEADSSQQKAMQLESGRTPTASTIQLWSVVEY